MSWICCPDATSKYDVAYELLIENLDHTLAWELRGSVLWTVLDDIADVPVIVGFLLRYFDFSWAYRPMEEDAHPFYYTCPLQFLELAPTVCERWRAKVRKYYARRRC